MKEVTEVVIKYESDDGVIFDTHEQAEHHERLVSGIRRVCPDCKGSGRVMSNDMRYMEPCSDCNSKGWQEKVEVWK